ncbi:MAG: protein arginine kinase [Candidatus Omnitrophica bacterium]|nr:protein arginine kinase [Candidatus Omnitrophota bacterium]
MRLDDLIVKRSEWLRGEGPESSIAMSTRVRVARNLKGRLYFSRANKKEREETLNILFAGVKKSSFFKDALFLKVREISDTDKQFLVERHLMSREHAEDIASKGLVIEEKEIASILLNEEDHIRLQVIESGFNVLEAWKAVDNIDTDLSKHMQFDFSNKFGYLTSCPTNTGTGLRASVMLHLSALAMTSQIDGVFDAISKLGLTMRGFYGEGTEAIGDFYQISNQVALGYSEEDILDNLERIIKKIISRERETRINFLRIKKFEIEDRIQRSYGTLRSAKIITSSETIKLLSAIRLGIDLGIIKDVDIKKINEVLLLTQPAHLQKVAGKEIPPYERDIKRSDFIREKLGVA